MNDDNVMSEKFLETIQDFLTEYMYKNKIVLTEDNKLEINSRFFEIGESGIFALLEHGKEIIGSILSLENHFIVSQYYDELYAESQSSIRH